jgi:hypothetical protein
MKSTGRHFGKRRAALGQGAKYRSHFSYYRDGHLHPECAPAVRAACSLCAAKAHPLERSLKARAACTLCLAHAADQPYWYPSRDEARTAQRLDEWLAAGKIKAWRRARACVLTPGLDGGQRPITYTPDFVVTLPDDQVQAWEVKGSAFVIADDARLKIKLYRAAAALKGWPPLVVMNGKGESIHV